MDFSSDSNGNQANNPNLNFDKSKNRPISSNSPHLNSPADNFSGQISSANVPSSSNFGGLSIGQQQQRATLSLNLGQSHGPPNFGSRDGPGTSVAGKISREFNQNLTGDEFSSARTSSVAGSDVDFDDVKSTGSSHPFSSPNPSEFDEHGLNLNFANPVEMHQEFKRHYGPYKRRKQQQADLINASMLQGGGPRLAYPLSERQQMALLMQMTAPDQHPDQPKSPSLLPAALHQQHHSGAKVRGKMARIHRRNDRGETALHLGAKRGDSQQCLELIREGAEVNVVDYAGWTPLHEACNKGWVETAEILIKNGANVNACGLEDDTPLHDAALNGNKNLVILLLEHGADPFKSNARGKRPVDIVSDDNAEIQDLLLKYSRGLGHQQEPQCQNLGHASSAESCVNFDQESNINRSLNDENAMEHEITMKNNEPNSQILSDYSPSVNRSSHFSTSQIENQHQKFDTNTNFSTSIAETPSFSSYGQFTNIKDKKDFAENSFTVEENNANETIVLSDTTLDETQISKNNESVLNTSADSDNDNRLVVVEDEENCLKIVEPIAGDHLFSSQSTTPAKEMTQISNFLAIRSPEISQDQAKLEKDIENHTCLKDSGPAPSLERKESQKKALVALPVKSERPKRRLVPPTRPYDSALAPQTSPRTGRKRKGVHRHHHHGAHHRQSQSAKNQPHQSAFYRPGQTPPTHSSTTNQNQASKAPSFGTQDEKDVYEFHSSDSDFDSSSNSNSNNPNNTNSVAPVGLNRRKLLKLTEDFDHISMSDKQMTSSDVIFHHQGDHSLLSRDAAVTKIAVDPKKSMDFNKTATSMEPSDTHKPMTVTLETPTKNAGDPNLHKSSDELSPRGRSISFTPNTAIIFPPTSVNMGVSGSLGGAPAGHVTNFTSSRKERLLGYRRKRGSHLHNRFLVKKAANIHQHKFQFPASVGNLPNNADISLSSSSSATNQTGRKSDPDIASAWRRSSSTDLAESPPTSSGHVTGTRTSTSPKVPPLKLILSSANRNNSFSGQGAPGSGPGVTDDESSLPSNPTYFVRNKSGTTLAGATPDKNDHSEIISAALTGNGGGSSSNSGTASPSVAVSEANQRITRSQVRLHGADLSRQSEASPVAPQPVHPRKRKIKSTNNHHGGASGGSSKTIEPVAAANRHPKPLISTNLALMASKNPYEAQTELRKMIERKWQEAKETNNSIQYTPPKGYDKFLMSKKAYLLKSLEENNQQKMEIDKPPNETIPQFMRDLYNEQEKDRENMKTRHKLERERLIMSCETEALRVHNRITRGTVDPPISAMRVLRDAEIYNTMQLDKPFPLSYSALSIERYSETTSINDVLTRFMRSKNQLIGRHRLEADCLFSTQFNEWETKFKACDFRLIENNKYANFSCSRVTFPSVAIVTDFDLLPSELAA